MGGNVFKDGSTRRYNADEYFDLAANALSICDKFSKRVTLIPSYTTKESHGDMDILLTPDIQLSKSYLSHAFNTDTDHVVHNGDVWSLVYSQIQVDLITTPIEEFDDALDYFSWNDFGNLRGKIIHKFGLKFGHRGLTFPVKNGDYLLGEIVLSRNPAIINELFDFKLKKVYHTLPEIFETVIASKYFNPKVFAFESMNSVARIRDKKRTTYHAFLKYIEDMSGTFYEFNKDKSYYHNFIFENFPHAKIEFDRLNYEREIQIMAAKKFNANIVIELTGRTGPCLGDLMKKLKTILTAEKVVDMDDEYIKTVILQTHKNALHI